MSGGAKQAVTSTMVTPSSRKKRSRGRRSLIAAGARVLLLLGGKELDEALGCVAPQLLDHLPCFLNALRTASRWAQGVSVSLSVALLVCHVSLKGG